jgi:hypothetical protein
MSRILVQYLLPFPRCCADGYAPKQLNSAPTMSGGLDSDAAFKAKVDAHVKPDASDNLDNHT